MDALAKARAAPRGEIQPPDKKAKANPTSRKYAIYHMCYQCFGGDPRNDPGGKPDDGYRDQIRHCTAKACALYPHRPYRPK